MTEHVVKCHEVLRDVFQPFITIEGSVNDSVAVDTVPADGLATVRVVIKIPPQSSADWTFRADVGQDADIGVCSVHIVDYGYAVPCLNESTPMRSIGRTGLQGYETGWLDLYKLSNIGQSYLLIDSVHALRIRNYLTIICC